MWLLHHSEMLLLLDIIPDPYKVRYISILSWTLVPCFLFQLTSLYTTEAFRDAVVISLNTTAPS